MKELIQNASMRDHDVSRTLYISLCLFSLYFTQSLFYWAEKECKIFVDLSSLIFIAFEKFSI